MQPPVLDLNANARPSVLLTYACSLDGSIAARAGAPLALSGHAALRLTHQLRATHDALLVGIGTVLIDNPKLDVRYVVGPNPRPIILDAHLRCPPHARCMDVKRGTLIVTTPHAPKEKQQLLEQAGAVVLRVASAPGNASHVDLRALLQALGARHIRSLMVEGGAQVITAFLQAQLVDRVVITFAPTFIGGVKSVNMLLENFPRLKNVAVTQLDGDVIVQGEMDWNARA